MSIGSVFTIEELGIFAMLFAMLLIVGRDRGQRMIAVPTRFVRKGGRQTHRSESNISFDAIRQMDPPSLVSIWQDGEMSAFSVFAGLAAQGVTSAPVLDQLLPALEDRSAATRSDALEVFAAVGFEAGPYAQEVARGISHSDRRVQESALLALAAMGPAAASVAPQVLTQFPSLEPAQQRVAVRALGASRAWQVTGSFLLALCSSEDPLMVEEVCWALEKCEDDIPQLGLQLLRCFVERPELMIPEALAHFTDEDSLSQLLIALDSEKAALRQGAAQLIRLSAEKLTEAHLPQLTQHLFHEDQKVMGQLALALQDAPFDALEVLAPFYEVLTGSIEHSLSGDDPAQLEAALGLCTQFPQLAAVVEENLPEFFLHQDERVRARAFQLAGNLKGEGAYQQLSGFILESDSSAREMVAASLVALFDEADSLAPLLALSRDKFATVRAAALRVFVDSPLVAKNRALLEVGLEDLSFEVRWVAAAALVGSGLGDPGLMDRCINELRQAVILGTAFDRELARKGLKAFATPEAIAACVLPESVD